MSSIFRNEANQNSYSERSVYSSYADRNARMKSMIRSSADMPVAGAEHRDMAGKIRSQYPAGYMRKGDRIYVCVMQYGRRLLEFSVNNVDSYTALMGEIRYAGRGLEGLMKVFIRNHTRGWSEERPLKFYSEMPAPRRRVSRGAVGQVRLPAEGKRMLAPWETH